MITDLGNNVGPCLWWSSNVPSTASGHLRTRPACAHSGASLSDTFHQTLPDLVTPLKGHSLSPRSCPPTRSARPPKGLGTNNYDCRSNLAPKHARKHETHPPLVKKKEKKKKGVPSRFKRSVGFIWAGVSNMVSYIKQTSDIIWVVCNKLTTVWAPTTTTKNCSLADSFLDPMV